MFSQDDTTLQVFIFARQTATGAAVLSFRPHVLGYGTFGRRDLVACTALAALCCFVWVAVVFMEMLKQGMLFVQ